MIDEVSIFNYKSVAQQRFSLGRINMFVGESGSGKTNMLEALGMAAAAHDKELDDENLKKRGIRATSPATMFHKHSQSKVIEIAWYEKNSWKKAKLVCTDPDETCSSWDDISWYEPEYIEKVNNLIQFIGDGSIEGEYPFADESKNTVLNAAFRGSRNFRDYIILNPKANELKELSETPEKIISSLNEEQKQKINCYRDNLPVLFFLSLFFDRSSPLIFAIDDVENLLTPDVCSDLIQLAAQLAVKHNKQAFITTSNPAFANALNLNLPEQKLFSVKMTDNDQTVITEVKDGAEMM